MSEKKRPHNFVDLTGQKFGRWTALEYRPKNKGRSYYLCKCECGKEKEVAASIMKNGDSKSCGCLNAEVAAKRMTKHGQYLTPEYRTWQDIIKRCHNPKTKCYPRYGGRGIKVCERWRNSFENFIEDMGKKPSPKHSIERRENNGDYEPSNCHWATNEEQVRNKRTNVFLEWNGKRMIVADWAKEIGVDQFTLYARISNGWSTERALTTPTKRKII